MKILHLISQAPDYTGSGKYIQAMLMCSTRKGHQNFLVAGVQNQFTLDANIIPESQCRYVWFNGVEPSLPYPLPGMSDVMPYDHTIFSRMTEEETHAYESAFKTAIIEAVERFRPDIIHSHHLWIVSVLACEVAPHIPVVTTCHGTCLRQYNFCSVLGPRVGGSCSNISRVIALSYHQKDEIKKTHGIPEEQIDVIPGGFDETIFYPEERSLQQPVEILYAGKLCRAKGVPWLLNSIRLLDKSDFKWRLHLAGTGSGEELEKCLDLADSLGSKVVVHGALSHTDLANLMRKSHIFVLPSFYEGLPLVLMEALACGCRVLTTALPGTKEMFADKESKEFKRLKEMEKESSYEKDDLVSLIELPELETVDKPFESDIPYLEQQLKSALEKLIATAVEHPNPDFGRCRLLTEPCSWKRIFESIEKVYLRCLDSYF
ncbi:putative glycogen synthase (Starch (bacterial glycogen) synthase) [Desulfamplus magnetovallimortis]|uniref:Putative glycogen synthase (Starch (Bacterial glycogen) synthase) n=1 Tax=Desulfamplus magnetovallimortis TaxID=1246637 RepID=A0A1W1HAF0_9BACT|nr:glycosyltransferase family 4 protein [Desulfamplus magnetovallimortis]SLM29461.1 putative glycogen synthase (Starch (bacterial glycogen) synthase) [Desulfamplus magnetovallimortis]